MLFIFASFLFSSVLFFWLALGLTRRTSRLTSLSGRLARISLDRNDGIRSAPTFHMTSSDAVAAARRGAASPSFGGAPKKIEAFSFAAKNSTLESRDNECLSGSSSSSSSSVLDSLPGTMLSQSASRSLRSNNRNRSFRISI